jgi:hypothetical protein
MRTRIARTMVVVLRDGNILNVGTAHTGFGQPGGDHWFFNQADH